MKLDPSVALVTGSAKRVGRAIALELANAGCDIALHYRRSVVEAQSVAAAVKRQGRHCVLIEADLENEEAPRRIIEETLGGLRRLDVLVNNAAVFDELRIDEFDWACWDRAMRVNVSAPAALCHHARPYLESAGGAIVNICDIGAERVWPSHLGYCVSKAGLVALTRGLARALAPRVRVNGVSPGIALFPEDYDETLRQRLIATVPLRRAGTPEDIARVVRFLIEHGDYITGQIIRVDGGRTL